MDRRRNYKLKQKNLASQLFLHLISLINLIFSLIQRNQVLINMVFLKFRNSKLAPKALIY